MILDNLSEIKKLDKANMLGSIEVLADQCRQAWQDLKGVNIPRDYHQVKNIVVAGMGGSAIGAHIVKSLFTNELKVPLEIINDYHLPAYVNKEALVVLSSYSGSTEETVSCLSEIKERQSKVLVMTSGKDLAEFLKKDKLPGYLFTPRFNPCGSPRIGLGYSLFGLLILFGKIGFIKFSEPEAQRSIRIIEKNNKSFGVSSKELNNQAKQLAKKLLQKIPIYFSGGFLAGNIHTAANQLNENAKTFGSWFLLPEINHHLMEGLVFPKVIKESLSFVFFESALNEPRIQKRFELTKEAVKKSGIQTSSYKLQGKNKLDQVFEMLVLGSYIGFYLAMLYEIDPTPIPVVDWFKKNM